MKKEKMIYKAYSHYYSMRLRPYLKKEELVNLYAAKMSDYCRNHDFDVTMTEIMKFLDEMISDDPKGKNIA